jgi:phage FluMu protein Com
MKSEKSILKCNFCGHVFKRVITKNTYEIQCPKCREIDVEYIGQEKQ